ncbi:MAG: Gldg family protein [Myxococcota bacterium]
MALIDRWAWTLGLAAGVLGLGALLGLAMDGMGSGSVQNLGLAAIGLGLLYAAVRREALLAWFREASTTRTLSNVLATALAFALTVGLVTLAGRNEQTLDLTRTGRNTLSDQSIRMLEGMTIPVQATAFATALSPGREEVARLLRRAQGHTDQLTVEFVDPIAAPAQARDAGITGEQSVVMVQAPGRPPVRMDGTIDETDLISALVEATSEVLHQVCWTVDHGEADPDDETSAAGLGGVRTALERLNYQVTLTRLVAEGIEPSCELVVIARPVLTLSDQAIAKLDAYVLGGGQLFVLLEPQQSPNLSAWLGRYGLITPPWPLEDPRASYQIAGADASALWLPSEGGHPITSDLAGFAFIGARAVDPDYQLEGVEVDGLVWTSDDARQRPSSGNPLANGPYAVVSASRIDAPRALGPLTRDAPPLSLQAGGRVVVVGDADFASRRGAQLANNTDLFLNTIAWLVREPAQVGARPSPAEALRLSQGDLAVQAVLFVVLWPALAIAGAVAVLVRRRYR